MFGSLLLDAAVVCGRLAQILFDDEEDEEADDVLVALDILHNVVQEN